MGKKIMILNGSPRRKGNTAALIDSFVRGAEETGNDITRFNLHEMKIKPCLGCMKGGKDKESPCVQKDDMEQIYTAFNEADIIVLASPMYYWSFTAQLKTAIDRLFATVEANGNLSSYKEVMMLLAAGDDSDENFAPTVSYYETLVRFLSWKDRGMVLAGGVTNIGDIEGDTSLEDAYVLGKSS